MNDPIAPIVSQFEQDPNAIRIQKLLCYVCRNQWQSEIARFDVSQWRSLIDEVKAIHPTFEQLRSKLTHQIGTLNKSKEYAAVGQIVLSVLERAYAQDAVTIVTAPKRSTQLEQDINIHRIKKLLIYTCKQYWEANSYVIEQASVSDLIDELIKKYASAEDLRSGLHQIVKTLNKSVEYSLIAEIILRAVEPLYGKSQERVALDHTQPIDLFDVRREILKSANPLQAKVLLFSSVYYLFEFCQQDWSNLKLYSLDGLLRTVVIQAETIEEFQQLLNGKASQLKDAETYLEIVPVFVRSLKKNYDSLRQRLQLAASISSVADTTIAHATRAIL
ncbi:MAG: hypothetical protein MUC48_22355 [Leptolyngbya sp. Prado105]|jgi:hypothetical protein|nr:hypothetical protein [Leptolyngbya sp. Prado105]